MSFAKDTKNRLTLVRSCEICGKSILTTADTPWGRVMRLDSGKWKNAYFCSSVCYQASYKHKGWYDGKAEQRRAEREKNRDKEQRAATWKKYYAENGEKIRARRRQRYVEDISGERADQEFYRRKRKVMEYELR